MKDLIEHEYLRFQRVEGELSRETSARAVSDEKPLGGGWPFV
jgi:hypothetical protein